MTMKLTQKQKETHKQYLRKLTINNELTGLIFGKVKTVKCVKCKKNIEVKKLLDCRTKWITQMNSNKKLGISDSEFPFGIVQGMFQSSHPLVLCKLCQYDVYRFMGKIPDLYASSVFPQRATTGLSIDKFFEELKSKQPTIYEISYKGKKYKDSPKKYNQLLLQSVKVYLKKYPYMKYSEKQLVRILKNYKLQKLVTVF